MNKKGQEEWMPRIFMIIILVFILTVLVLFSVSCTKSEREITGISKSSVSIDLLNYLRTPILLEGKQQTMTDLIIISVNKNNYQDLELATKNSIGEYYSNNFKVCCWGIEIISNNKKEIKSNVCGYGEARNIISEAKVSDKIKIRLSLSKETYLTSGISTKRCIVQ